MSEYSTSIQFHSLVVTLYDTILLIRATKSAYMQSYVIIWLYGTLVGFFQQNLKILSKIFLRFLKNRELSN